MSIIHTYIHACTHIYTCMHTCTHTYIHTHTSTYIHSYIHKHTYIHKHILTYTYTYTHIHVHTYTKPCTRFVTTCIISSHLFCIGKTAFYLDITSASCSVPIHQYCSYIIVNMLHPVDLVLI